jgi:hypothetical protein
MTHETKALFILRTPYYLPARYVPYEGEIGILHYQMSVTIDH